MDIRTRCAGTTRVALDKMEPIQGALKNRTLTDIDLLSASLREKGLLSPFVLWRPPSEDGEDSDLHYAIIDGHGRYTALMQMCEPASEWPAIIVNADTEKEAREILLEINARYGRITPRGLEAFLKDVPRIRIPTTLGVRMPTRPIAIVNSGQRRTHRTVHIRVPEDKFESLKKLLNEVTWIEIL